MTSQILLTKTIIDNIAHTPDGHGGAYIPQVIYDVAQTLHANEMQIRSSALRIIDKMMAEGLLDWSADDHNEDSKYRVLSKLGWDALEDRSYLDIILGPYYTLQNKRQAVFLIQATINDDIQSGTAFHIGSGWFASCGHCLPQEGNNYLLFDTRLPDDGKTDVPSFMAHDVYRCDQHDVAFFRADGVNPSETVQLTAHSPVDLAPVLVLHFPNIATLLRSLIATTGEVNGRAYNMVTKEHHLLISARTAGGSSGGPVLDSRGRLAGIVVGSGYQLQKDETIGDKDTSGASPHGPQPPSYPTDEPFFHAIPGDIVFQCFKAASL